MKDPLPQPKSSEGLTVKASQTVKLNTMNATHCLWLRDMQGRHIVPGNTSEKHRKEYEIRNNCQTVLRTKDTKVDKNSI